MTKSDLDPREGHASFERARDRYELGAMSVEERASFESHALQCDECFAELEHGAAAATVLRAHGLRLLGADTQQRARFAVRRSEWRTIGWSMAAAVAVIWIAAGVVLPAWRRSDLQDLASYPRETSASTLVRGAQGTEAGLELLDAGLDYLEAGSYTEAERRFDRLRRDHPDEPRYAYLSGLSRALGGDPRGALPALEESLTRAQGELRVKVTWTLANANLASGRLDRAREALGVLAVSNAGAYADSAARLLARLGS
jgi:hypothetical protein